jgi:hypothetical protein
MFTSDLLKNAPLHPHTLTISLLLQLSLKIYLFVASYQM